MPVLVIRRNRGHTEPFGQVDSLAWIRTFVNVMVKVISVRKGGAMNKRITLGAHTTFGPMNASATLQVRPAEHVVPDPSPALKYARQMNPLSWSASTYTRIAVLATFLLELIDQFNRRS